MNSTAQPLDVKNFRIDSKPKQAPEYKIKKTNKAQINVGIGCSHINTKYQFRRKSLIIIRIIVCHYILPLV